MARALSSGKAETYTQVTTLMMNEAGMERCTGLMGPFIRANGRKVFSTEEES